MKNKYKALLSNSVFFAIGNLGSKFITFIMLPLYTYQLTSAQFGTVDLIQTTVSLLLPIISLSIFDAILRFTLDENSDYEQIFSNGILVTAISSAIIMIFGVIGFELKYTYAFYMVTILIMQSFQSLFSQYAKAIGEIKIFALNGIALTFLTAGFNLILLVGLKWNINGFLLSIILANIVSNYYLIKKLRLFDVFSIHKISIKKLSEMLHYSVPLIPNSIAWWATSTINKYFILYFIDVAANGIYAVANRIPSLLSVMNSIFFQSWQISAIKEYENKNKNEFYSNVFNAYSKFMFLGVSGVLFILIPMMKVLISREFFISWKYVPFLLMTVLYSSFAGFFGQYYIAAKKTNGIFITTVIGGVINIILNFIIIPIFGLQGAGISSCISFFALWFIRVRTTRSFVITTLNKGNLICNHLILYSQIVSILIIHGTWMYVLNTFLFVLSLLTNIEIVNKMWNIIWKIGKSRVKNK